MLGTLFAVGAGTQIMSTFMQGQAAEYEAKAEQELNERNAIILDQEAVARQEKAKFDQARQAEAAEIVIGELTATMGGSGLRIDVGAPIRLLEEQRAELDLDNYLIGYEGITEVAALRDRATMSRYFGKVVRQRGKNIRRSANLQAFGQGMSFLGEYLEKFG